MSKLNYEVLEKTGYEGYILKDAPEKVLQFGEGNFLRAFVDYWYDIANEKADYNGKVVLVQPRGRRDHSKAFNEQEALYTLYLRGTENGQQVNERRVISAASRCLNPYMEEGYKALMEVAVSDDLEVIVSNTTEAGIVYDPSCQLEDKPAESFPGKLTQVLYARYKAKKAPIIMLACELIDDNGKELLKCVNKYIAQWGLEEEFYNYVNKECIFCGSLVDRIVPGAIRDPKEVAELEEKHGYEDPLLVVGEVFGVWVIEGPDELNDRLPFKKAGLGDKVFVVNDMKPYKKRKVRILNGAHTGFALGAFLSGEDIIRDCMNNDMIRGFMNKMIFEEIIPVLPLDKKDVESFAAATQDRFANPFIDHAISSISLNTAPKWKARNLPSLLEYTHMFGKLPKCLTMSFAFYIAFYSNNLQALTEEGLVAKRWKGDTYVISDEREILEAYWAHKDDTPEELVESVLSHSDKWGLDLNMIPGFYDEVLADLKMIRTEGSKAAFAYCLES